MAGETYKIKKGDTLGKIAKKHDTTVSKLAELNDIEDVNKIYAGETIKLKEAPKKTKKIRKKKKTDKKKEKEYFNPLPSNALPFLLYKAGAKLGLPETKMNYDAISGMSPEAKDVMFQAIGNAAKRGSSSVGYQDYPPAKEGGKALDFITPPKEESPAFVQSGFLGSLGDTLSNYARLYGASATDPVKEVASLLGKFNFEPDGSGGYYISDDYNFQYAPEFNVDGRGASVDVPITKEGGFSFPIRGLLQRQGRREKLPALSAGLLAM